MCGILSLTAAYRALALVVLWPLLYAGIYPEPALILLHRLSCTAAYTAPHLILRCHFSGAAAHPWWAFILCLHLACAQLLSWSAACSALALIMIWSVLRTGTYCAIALIVHRHLFHYSTLSLIASRHLLLARAYYRCWHLFQNLIRPGAYYQRRHPADGTPQRRRMLALIPRSPLSCTVSFGVSAFIAHRRLGRAGAYLTPEPIVWWGMSRACTYCVPLHIACL